MAKIRIPCLVGKTNKAGVTSWYWQPSKTLAEAGWAAIALGKNEGAALAAARLRNDEVERWKIHGEHTGPSAAEIRKRHQAGTFGALIARYRREIINGRKSDGSPLLARTTQKTYGTALERLDRWAGKHPLAFITRARVKALKLAMLAPAEKGGIGHYGAHATLKMGRVLFAFAIDCDLVEQDKNPFVNFGLAAPDPRDVIWSPPAREALVLAAYDCGMPSLALAIMLGFAIGQREQDLLALIQRQYVQIPAHKMQPEDYATLAAMAPDGVPRGIRVRQLKTKAWIEVPVVGQVRWAAETAIETARAAGSTTILIDDTRQSAGRDPRHYRGMTYTDAAGQSRFQRDFAEVREWAAAAVLFEGDAELAAEIETLHFSDLRRTCVVYLGELGMDAHLIAGVTGHDIDETQRILRTYMPRTTGRAARAIALASVREAKEAENAAEREKTA